MRNEAHLNTDESGVLSLTKKNTKSTKLLASVALLKASPRLQTNAMGQVYFL